MALSALSSYLAPQADAAEWRGYAVLTTDYVFRGVTFSDSGPAAQIGAEVLLDNGLFLGAWASTVDIQAESGNSRNAEVDYYLGYSFALDERWAVTANAVAYTFPGADGGFDYDYEEYSLSFSYRDSVWLEYSYSPSLFETRRTTHNVSAYAERALSASWLISAGVGHYNLDDLAGESYTYWEAGVSHAISNHLDIDVRYHDTSRSVRFISNPDRADARVAASVRLTF